MPEPETEHQENIVPVSDPIIVTFQQFKNSDWSVQHHVKSGKLYVECVVPSVTFTSNGHNGRKGKVVVSVDGKQIGEYKRAAFIVKNIPKGKRTITVEIVSPNNQPYGMKTNFTINI